MQTLQISSTISTGDITKVSISKYAAFRLQVLSTGAFVFFVIVNVAAVVAGFRVHFSTSGPL